MRIWTVFTILFKNFELLLRDLFRLPYRPYKLLLELTDFCNSKCKTCYIWKVTEEKKNEIRVSELEPVLKEYGRHILWIALGGGEISLYSDFDRLLQVLVENCPNLRIVTFTTNGLKPDKILDLAEKIKSCGYDLFVTVSLDGDRETHDYIRGVNGNFEKAQQTFALLKMKGIWSHFGLTVSKLNVNYIADKLKNDIQDIRAFSFEHSGGIYKTPQLHNEASLTTAILNVKNLYRIRTLAEGVEYVYIVLAEKFFASAKKKLPVPCEVVSASLHIRPNGDINGCMYLPALGHIKNANLKEMLNLSATRKIRERAISADCEKCWMNCYAPHSIMRHPILALKQAFIK